MEEIILSQIPSDGLVFEASEDLPPIFALTDDVLYIICGGLLRGQQYGIENPPLMKSCHLSAIVEAVAEVAGINYRTVKVDLHDKPAWFFKANEKGTTPTICYNTHLLAETSDILHFMRATFPEFTSFCGYDKGQELFAGKELEQVPSALTMSGVFFVLFSLMPDEEKQKLKVGKKTEFEAILADIESAYAKEDRVSNSHMFCVYCWNVVLVPAGSSQY